MEMGTDPNIPQVREPYKWVNHQVISMIISDIKTIEKHFADAERKII